MSKSCMGGGGVTNLNAFYTSAPHEGELHTSADYNRGKIFRYFLQHYVGSAGIPRRCSNYPGWVGHKSYLEEAAKGTISEI
jgi:hypothetical protein